MKKSEIPALCFWIGLSVFVMYSSCRFGLGSLRSPGPGLMPFLLGALLGLVSLYFLMTVLSKRGAKERAGRETNDAGSSGADVKKIAVVVVSLIVYALLLEKLGYVVTTLPLLYCLFWVAGTKKLVAAISSVVTVSLTYFGFSYLGVVFPQGILRFIIGV